MAKSLLSFAANAFVGDGNEVLVAGDAAARPYEVHGRPCVAFDASDEECATSLAIPMPQAYASGTLTAKLHCIMASATTGKVDMEVAVEAITPGDAIDLLSADGFDAINEASGGTSVPGTAGYPFVISVTLTNKDSVAKGDMVRLAARRDCDDADDTAPGDLYLLCVEIQEA